MGASISSLLTSTPEPTPGFDAVLRVENPDALCRALHQLFTPGGNGKPVIMLVGDPASGKSTLAAAIVDIVREENKIMYLTSSAMDNRDIQPGSLVFIDEAKDDFPNRAFLDKVRKLDIMGVVFCSHPNQPPELVECNHVQCFQMLPHLEQSEKKDQTDLWNAVKSEHDAIKKKLSYIAKSTPVFDSLLRVESPDLACRALGRLLKPGDNPVIMFVGSSGSGKSTLLHGLCSLIGTHVTFITKFHTPDDMDIVKDSLVVILKTSASFPTPEFLDKVREDNNTMGVIACGVEYPPQLNDCDHVQVIPMKAPLEESEKKPGKDLLRALRYEKKALHEKLNDAC